MKCNVIESISPNWYKAGKLLGLEACLLQTFALKHQKDPIPCCDEVMSKWITAGSPDYPLTMRGLFILLSDLDEKELIKKLNNAVQI